VVLLCEHPPAVSIGRSGSRRQVSATDDELQARGLELRWVNRGGGAIVHGPGQLAVYPIIPLDWHAMRVGEYMEKLGEALRLALTDVRVVGRPRDGHGQDLWGRTGQLVHVGVSVKSWTSYFGAYINVSPMRTSTQFVLNDRTKSPVSCLSRETQAPIRPAALREGVLRRLAETLNFEHSLLSTGHPLLARTPNTQLQ
jgi:lipoyl(octanoyl) transferase